MDEDIAIISSETRNQKIKNFLINNKKTIIIFFSIIFVLIISFFVLKEFKQSQKLKISNLYNSIIINYSDESKDKTKDDLINLIKEKDSTYSLLSLYFLIDNDLIENRTEINQLFDFIIKNISLDKEIRNLVILKKALFNADNIEESELLEILNPIINKNSVWKPHALYMIAEYFFSNNEKEKSKEFYLEIVNMKDIDPDFIRHAQKRLNRDLSD